MFLPYLTWVWILYNPIQPNLLLSMFKLSSYLSWLGGLVFWPIRVWQMWGISSTWATSHASSRRQYVPQRTFSSNCRGPDKAPRRPGIRRFCEDPLGILLDSGCRVGPKNRLARWRNNLQELRSNGWLKGKAKRRYRRPARITGEPSFELK